MGALVREEKALQGSNLGAVGQNTRFRHAIVGLTLSLGLTILLVQLDQPRIFRLALFLPFLFTAMGAVQGLYRTCPFHSKKGTREGDCGTETVGSEDEMSRAKCLGRRVFTIAGSSALAATTIVYLLP